MSELLVLESEGGLLLNPPSSTAHTQFLAPLQEQRWQQQQQQADFHEKRASVGLMGGTALGGDKRWLITREESEKL